MAVLWGLARSGYGRTKELQIGALTERYGKTGDTE
jgi:hypothetical protein